MGDKCWRDALMLNSHNVNPNNGDRVGIQIGVDMINKKVCIMKDTRNLSETWNGDASATDASMTLSGSGLNPYISSDLGTISISADATYEELRKQIYGMGQIKNDVKSYKHLLLSWVHFVHRTPLSFPMLKDGKLAGQKNFNSANKELCVEIMDEEIETMHKHTRCLHIFLAKIHKLEDKPIGDDDEEEKKTDVKEAYGTTYWPCDHHIRLLYSEGTNEDKVTYKNVSAFISTKYDIALENIMIAMFRVNRAEWILVDGSCDNEENKHGLAGKPFNIKKPARNGQLFAVIDLSKCQIEGSKEQKREFIKENLKYLGVPPLAPEAKILFKRANQHASLSLSESAKNINNSYNNQLTISGID